jgi:outer membrane protein
MSISKTARIQEMTMTSAMRHSSWALIAGLLVAAVPASSADLLSIYDQALINDPQIREAEANRRAQREVRPQAIAGLLPQVSATAGRTRDWSDSDGFNQFTFTGAPGPTTSSTGGVGINNSDQWRLQIRQSVFSWNNWVALRTANHEVAQAEADYLVQRQALAQRVAQQYFAVLNAQDNVSALEAARDAIARQLEQAERRFEVGLIAITDVQEARAERDTASANVIGAKRTLANAEEQLRATIGEKPAGLNEPSEDMPLKTPEPANEEDWVRASMDIARDGVQSAFGNHLPTVDIVAGRSFSDTDGKRTQTLPNGTTQISSSASEGYAKSMGIQFTLPIFSGGATQSRVRQSQQLWIAAKERLERTSRNTERLARDGYLGVSSEIARVQALKQAMVSSRSALAATEAGYEVGTRTSVDVLNSRRLLIQTQRDYSAAKYSYLNNLIQLQLASGDLDRGTIEEVNRWLTVAPGTAATNQAPRPVAVPAPAQ